MQLRDYQEIGVNEIFRKLAGGLRRICFQLSTGGGKTVCFSAVIQQYLQQFPNKRVLVVVHRDELLTQAMAKLMEFAGIKSIPIISGVRYAAPSQVYVAMIETANNRLKQNPAWFGDVGMLIVDECHRGEHKKIYEYFPDAKIVGFTATPISSSKKDPLNNYFDDIVSTISIEKLIAQGALTPNRTYHIKNINRKALKIDSKGEFNTKMMGDAFSSGKHVKNTVDAYEKFAKGTKAIVFNCNIEHSKLVHEEFLSRGYPSRNFDSKENKKIRPELMQWFKNTPGAILNNIDIFTTGVDETSIETIMMNRSTLSKTLWIQCLDADTEILTADGFKKHYDVENGDKVASFNPKNKRIEFVPCSDKIVRPVGNDEQMYSLKSPFIDLRVTGGHRLLQRSRTRNIKHEFFLEEAQNVANNKHTYEMPIAGYTDKKGLDLTDSQIMLLGWWLSDGTIDKRTQRISISQSESQPKWLHDSIIKCIEGSGYKYRINKVKRKGDLAKYADLIQYRICKGIPRGVDKHLRGCSDMIEYFDKNISDKLFEINRRQLSILLEGLHNGDGTKPKNAYWTPRSRTIAAGDNRIYAERLQMIFILNGYKCNISTYHYNKSIIYVLLIKDRDYASIKGKNESDGNKLMVSDHKQGELVWCCSTKYETLVTRRNGKVVIMGNCGGRGSRLHPGKKFFTIIDMGGNAKAHCDWNYPHDWTYIFHNPDRPKESDGIVPQKECEGCEALIPAQARVCPFCGYIHEHEVFYDSGIPEFELVTTNAHAINVNEVIAIALGHNDYHALHNIKGRIISDARKRSDKITTEQVYTLLSAYHDKVQEWCKAKKKNFDQWHKDTTAKWFFAEIKRQFGWEQPQLSLDIAI